LPVEKRLLCAWRAGEQRISEAAKREHERRDRTRSGDPNRRGPIYTVHVFTADERFAGTDANVYINICGKNPSKPCNEPGKSCHGAGQSCHKCRRETGVTQLRKTFTNCFERGREDEFLVESLYWDGRFGFGQLTHVVIGHDGTGEQSGRPAGPTDNTAPRAQLTTPPRPTDNTAPRAQLTTPPRGPN
jgi:hypothetical protein